MIREGLDGLTGATPEICVVGAGPVGIVLALELARRGRQVLLLESGGMKIADDMQRLADAEITDTQHHVTMDVAVQRRLGGASNLWGGRCVAMEPYDFEPRPAVPHSGWPISSEDLAPFLPDACRYLDCGAPDFEDPLPGLETTSDDFRFARLERWSRAPRLGAVYARRLRDHGAIELRLRATVVGMDFAEDGRIETLRIGSPGAAPVSIAPRRVVLAAGGLENARLLLAAQRERPLSFGGEDGSLGRYYMGHLYGSVAEMAIHSPLLDAGMDYYLSLDRTYIRRRFTPSAELQQQHGLSNVALWPDYPPIHDARHRNGILSFAYLGLSVPWIGRRIVVESIRQHYVGSGPVQWMPHVGNVLREAVRTGTFVPGFFYRRYLARPRMPGFFQRNAARRYAIRFHAEHLPNPESRVVLARATDALGLPRLRVDLRYTEADAAPLLRAHECFAQWLETTKLGTLTWSAPESERAAYILAQCYDGHHQIGITRMATSPRQGVVDADCRVHGAANLFVAGSSVFPTSCEANPTLTAVTLGLRLAAKLAAEAMPKTTATLARQRAAVGD